MSWCADHDCPSSECDDYGHGVSGYRESAAPEPVPERYGFLACPQYRPNRVKPHKCSPPGFLDRLFLPVREGDMWRCKHCGNVFQWSRQSNEWFSAEWMGATDAMWRAACRHDEDGDEGTDE